MHDESLYFTAFPSCREFLNSIKSDVHEMARIDSMLIYGVEQRHEGKGSGIGDPTSGTAIFEIETQDKIIKHLESRREELETHVGYGLVFVAMVRESFHEPIYADVIELRYIDARTWGVIAESVGKDKRTCMRLRDVVCDWADYKGSGLFK